MIFLSYNFCVAGHKLMGIAFFFVLFFLQSVAFKIGKEYT